MLKEELKAILQADVDKVDIHFDFNDSAKAHVKVQLKGIPEHFEYEYEETSVHSMKINKLDAQLEELGSAMITRVNNLAKVYGLIDYKQVQGLIESCKDWLKDDLKILKGENVLLNGKVVGKCINFTKEFQDNTQSLLNYIEIKSDYKWRWLDEPVRIAITNEYGEIYQEVYGYLTEIRKLDDKVLIVIKQEIIDF